MHEITPQLEQVLRAQGLGDEELDELRRTGRVERGDGSGNSVVIEAGGDGTTPSAATFVTVDGAKLTTELPPAALEKLRRFHRFMPPGSVDGLERATGQDIDGDGRIGRGPSSTAAPAGAPTAGGTAPAEPHAVTVTGTGATPDTPVSMLEGATGARIPTGEHRRSGAMPAGSGDGPFVAKRGGIGSVLPLLLAVLVVLGIVVWIIQR